ncbi:alpha/beta fold hydrolase [Halomarina pelagica]|uniref:alpha/beta fold hydrolase n=1 Tax=Halomarina pelagica TaxID=2961599 RepID=UPI0020C2154F|nr:alpha/beta hydrolase [Halomarina sp. BND7]
MEPEVVTHDGRRTAYRRTDFGGGGPTVLYVHGSGGNRGVWVRQYGWREHPGPAVALDLSGHGESEDVTTPPGPETLDAYADDAVAVAREVGADVLVGNSLGGAVVQRVALDRSDDLDLAALVLCGTGAKLGVVDPLKDALATDFEGAIETLHGEDMLFHDADAEARAASEAAMRETGRAVTERDFLTCDAFDVRGRLGDLDAPCLAVTGEHDRLTPVAFHEYLAERLPDCDLSVVPDAAHLSMVEASAAWNAALAEFLDGRVERA